MPNGMTPPYGGKKPTWWGDWWATISGADPYKRLQETGRLALSEQLGWLEPRTRGIMERPQYAQREARRALGTIAPTGTMPSAGGAPGAGETSWATAPPTGEPAPGYQWRYEPSIGRYVQKLIPGWGVPEPREPSITPWQQTQIDWQQQQAAWERERYEMELKERRESEARAAEQAMQQFMQQMELQRRLAGLQEQQFTWQQEQSTAELEAQQAEAERVERARLSASPLSWLQYASYTGEEPVIQPWMQPLMPQQYQGLGAGEPIPGWTEEGGSAMPTLTRPSAQLYSRMGPTAQAQYAGYRQARTGARPEEQEFRRRATAPPGGRYGGLQWMR